MSTFRAGAGAVDISPVTSQFLGGYPHVERWSVGVHDPLMSTAIYLDDGTVRLFMIGNDNLYVSKKMVASARRRISEATGVPSENIFIGATHTHSAPITGKRGPGSYDKVTPDCDDAYLVQMENGIVNAAVAAYNAADVAEVGLEVARVSGIGTNRRSPDGPADPEIPVLALRRPGSAKPFAILEGYAMHPTVLHEDSKLCSADFPGAARKYLQEIYGKIPVAHFMGAAGNQSPRYCVRGQTFEEADRLGRIMGEAVQEAVEKIKYLDYCALEVKSVAVDYVLRRFPAVAESEAKVNAVREKLARQRRENVARAVVRTTECDLFGAEATYALSVAQEKGQIAATLGESMPAEIMLVRVGKWNFVGWQGEVFVEFALKIRAANPDTFVFTCSNGKTAGYLTTAQAADEGGYEASTSVFVPESGEILVRKTQELLG